MTLMRLSLLLLAILMVGCLGDLSSEQVDPRIAADVTNATVSVDSHMVRVTRLLQGSVLYHRNDCRKCHYSGAQSGGKARGPSLVDDEWLHCDGSINGIRSVIMTGVPVDRIHHKEQAQHTAMPKAADMGLSESDVGAIAAYLHAIALLDD